MSAALASSLVLLLFAAATAIAIIAFKMPALRFAVGFVGAAGLILLSYYYVGAWSRADPGLLPAASTGEAVAGSPACDRVVAILKEYKVLIDSSDPQVVVVNRNLWAQIPEPTKKAVLKCFEPEDGSGRPIEIIER